jgi:hypothetical protein
MAWQLSCEVAAYVQQADPRLTAGEIAVLYAIAERASFDGRHARLAWDSEGWSLTKASGSKTPKDIFQRLSARGVDVRVQHGVDSAGRPVYARRGMQTTYVLPPLGVYPQTITLGADSTAPNGVSTAPSDAETAPNGVETAPSPSFVVQASATQSSGPWRVRIAEVAGTADDDEIDKIIEKIKGSATGTIRNLGAYMRTVSDGDILEHVEAVRLDGVEHAERALRVRDAEHRRWAGTQSSCQHGMPGGWLIRLRHGDPFCPLCRRQFESDPDGFLAVVAGRMDAEGVSGAAA